MIQLDFNKSGGIIPAIAQDATSGEVLMLAYLNEEAWQKTLETGYAHYFSRSRGKIWKKGEKSGHVQKIKEIKVDCDSDTVLFVVQQHGGIACHEGYSSCFFRQVKDNELIITKEQIKKPDEIYRS